MIVKIRYTKPDGTSKVFTHGDAFTSRSEEYAAVGPFVSYKVR